jgi:hypothetical protein
MQAPGTFGWDHSKYRPPREGGDIQMDEFGRPVEQQRPHEDDDGVDRRDPFGRPLYPPTEHDRQPVGLQATAPTKAEGRRSPVPFAEYHKQPDGSVTIDLEAAKLKYGGKQQPGQAEDDAGGAGCCKCVVM